MTKKNTAAAFQQKTSEKAQQFNLTNNSTTLTQTSRSIQINGVDYNLLSSITGNDLCPHLITVNCLQMEFVLSAVESEIKAGIQQSLTFAIARSIEGDANQAYIQLLKGCLDETVLQEMVVSLAKPIFLGSKNGVPSLCGLTTQTINNAKMVVATSYVDTKTCQALSSTLTEIFNRCQRKAESKALEIGLCVGGGVFLLLACCCLYMMCSRNRENCCNRSSMFGSRDGETMDNNTAYNYGAYV